MPAERDWRRLSDVYRRIGRGENLYLNADARWGEIYAEIQDAETGKPHPGFWGPGEITTRRN